MIDLASKLNEGLVSGFKMAKEMVPQPSDTHDPVDVALKITDYLNRNSSSTMEERLVNVIKEIKPPEKLLRAAPQRGKVPAVCSALLLDLNSLLLSRKELI